VAGPLTHIPCVAFWVRARGNLDAYCACHLLKIYLRSTSRLANTSPVDLCITEVLFDWCGRCSHPSHACAVTHPMFKCISQVAMLFPATKNATGTWHVSLDLPSPEGAGLWQALCVGSIIVRNRGGNDLPRWRIECCKQLKVNKADQKQNVATLQFILYCPLPAIIAQTWSLFKLVAQCFT